MTLGEKKVDAAAQGSAPNPLLAAKEALAIAAEEETARQGPRLIHTMSVHLAYLL